MASSTTQRLLAVLLGVLLVGIAIVLVTGQRGAGTRTANSSSPFDGPTMPPNLRAADFSLVDQNGHRVSLSEYRGKVIILTFIHSLCRDTCPFMVEQIKGALNELPGGGAGVPAIGVSPARFPGQARTDRTTGVRQRRDQRDAATVACLRD
jgi:cytochrome oxidase Cu insertion factor (SCO1/SenC/PrrC family)